MLKPLVSIGTRPLLKGQRGFTLIELLAVIAILTVLSAIVAGAMTGIGASGQTARLEGDADSIGKAADHFFSEAFPQRYPVVSCCAPTDATSLDLLKAGDLGVRLIDFAAVLPGNPTKSFAPSFLKEVPNTAALVSWRIDTRNGDVFFAQDGTQLVRPSTNRLDVSAATASAGPVSNYTLELRMKKNEAALATLEVDIPAGYSIGLQPAGASVGTFRVTLSTDNPWSPGQVLDIDGTLKATGDSNKWDFLVDYPLVVNNHLTLARADRSHKVSIATPSQQATGGLSFKLDTTGDPAHNQATETWTLTIYGRAGNTPSGAAVITNPSTSGVYRWLAEQRTSIDVPDFFRPVSGNQAVIIKAAVTPTPTPAPTPPPTPTPAPTPPPVVAITPPAGLVSWWPGDGNANDIQGTNHGTLQGGATFAAGLVGQAFSFDGTNSVTLSSLPAISNLGSWTYDLWINVSSYTEGSYFVDRTSETHSLASLKAVNNQFDFQIRYNTAPAALEVAGGAINVGVWTHIAMVREFGVAFRLYVNGSLVASTADNGNSLTLPIPKLGHHDLPTLLGFGGLIDEFDIFNRALSASEVQAIYNAGSAGKVKP